MAKPATVKVELHGCVAVITMDRPDHLNAADAHLHQGLTRAFQGAAEREDLRAVVVTGAGSAFSAGGDLGLVADMVADRDLRAAMMAEGAALVRAVLDIPIPVIAAVNGPAVGMGCSLVSLCDLVVMEEQAHLADPHVLLGLVAADGAALAWLFLTSLLLVKEHLLLGEPVPAATALRIGLANRVVPQGQSLPVALELAQRLADLPRQAVEETKRLLGSALRRHVEAELDGGIAAEAASFDTPDLQSRVQRALSRQRS
jgi:enoyl-CoA hydratase